MITYIISQTLFLEVRCSQPRAGLGAPIKVSIGEPLVRKCENPDVYRVAKGYDSFAQMTSQEIS
jgi:hypothetical protein